MIMFTILIVWWGEKGGDQSCGTPIMLSWIRFRSVSTFITLDHNMLVNGYDFRRIGNVSFGQLGEVYKPVLLDAYIDESTEIGNIAYDARQIPFLCASR